MAQIAGAQPFAFDFDPATTAVVVIDMQRDFIEDGGFGASLGNDVRPLQAIVPTVARLLSIARRAGLTVIHTRECHRPDLSDCPPAKRLRGKPAARIGDPAPDGAHPDRGRTGRRDRARAGAVAGRGGDRQAGEGRVLRHRLSGELERRGVRSLIVAG